MGRRNWCQVDFDAPTGALTFDIRVEREKGGGETMGCVMVYICLGAMRSALRLTPQPAGPLHVLIIPFFPGTQCAFRRQRGRTRCAWAK